MLKTGLPAIADPETQLFILGSLPGDTALRDGRYYAHHSNQFWKLVGAVANEDLQSLNYEGRLARLRKRGIGLWDVINAARREGSEDSALRDASHNPIGELKDQFPKLQAIAFNGSAAATQGRLLLVGINGVKLYDLVSSSGLAGVALPEKIRRWRVIERHLK